jgi:hypothetical protein
MLRLANPSSTGKSAATAPAETLAAGIPGPCEAVLQSGMIHVVFAGRGDPMSRRCGSTGAARTARPIPGRIG